MNDKPSQLAVFRLGAFEQAISRRLDIWRTQELTRRIWSKDFKVWSPHPKPEITDRLGWLHLPEQMKSEIEDIQAAASSLHEGMQHVVLLGMGGSSLAPQVFHSVFGEVKGWPKLTVLDSTHPDEIRRIDSTLDYARTIFIVASKSGTTQETISLLHYFFERASHEIPDHQKHFVAITDRGTPLHETANNLGFGRIFLARSDVGGRYSALSHFGLVPAALAGADVKAVLERASRIATLCKADSSGKDNPGLHLGAVLGELALGGVDKVTFITSQKLKMFPDWIEQLIAESTGKDGKGIVPVTNEPPGQPDEYANDRFFVTITDGSDTHESEMIFRHIEELAGRGFPTCHFSLGDEQDIGGHMFVWEFAIAAACSALGVNAFDQPDVQLAKAFAKKVIEGGLGEAKVDDEINLATADDTKVKEAANHLLASSRAGDYFAIQAYLAQSQAIHEAIAELRKRVRKKFRLATTFGFGPRFLHSTGQLHKGGPDNGIFVQLVDEPSQDIPIPDRGMTFGDLIRAQAIGDYLALKERSRRVLRFNLGGNSNKTVKRLVDVL